jgi:hypothetical protein
MPSGTDHERRPKEHYEKMLRRDLGNFDMDLSLSELEALRSAG